MTCFFCEKWELEKGIYICPVCGSKDMVEAAQRPLRIKGLTELLKQVMALLQDELDEQEKARLQSEIEVLRHYHNQQLCDWERRIDEEVK